MKSNNGLVIEPKNLPEIRLSSLLLESHVTTNFIFEVQDIHLSETELEAINAINSRSKILDRIESLKAKGAKFRFLQTEQRIFGN